MSERAKKASLLGSTNMVLLTKTLIIITVEFMGMNLTAITTAVTMDLIKDLNRLSGSNIRTLKKHHCKVPSLT